jgi:hypothetical protein
MSCKLLLLVSKPYSLGTVEAERFIALINRERFDYTEWRKSQWQEETVASLAQRARSLREKA